MDSAKKNILIIIPAFFPGFKYGGPAKSVKNLVNNLGDEYNFFIFTRDRDFLDKEPYKGLEFNKWLDFAKVKIYYATPKMWSYSGFSSILKDIEFDIIFFNSFFDIKITLFPIYAAKAIYKKQPRFIISPRGSLRTERLKLKYFRKMFFVFLFKFLPFLKDVEFRAVTDDELKEIELLYPHHKMHQVENFPNALRFENIDTAHDKKPGHLKIVFISRISEIKNILFIFETLRKIKEGQIQFDIYGPIEDKEYWNKCLTQFETLPENVKVEYKGKLKSENVIPKFMDYDLFFFPSVSENFGHVIFESLSAGCPILISDGSPWFNVEESNCGWVLPLSEKQKFVDAVNNMLSLNSDEWKIKSVAAFNYAVNYLENLNLPAKFREMFK